MRTESYIKGFEDEVIVDHEYYFGELWDGNGDGLELLLSGSIAMYDEDIEEMRVVEFEVIDKDELDNLIERTGDMDSDELLLDVKIKVIDIL